MQIVYRKNVNGKYIDDVVKITSISDLTDVMTGKIMPLRYPINDFKSFNDNDLPYIKSVLATDKKYDRTQLFESFLYNVFKYRTKGQLGYWTSRGWNESDARVQISDRQRELMVKFREGAKRNGSYKKMFNTCIDYYTSRGYSEKDAKKKLKDRQTTFTLDKCIKQYGEENGRKRFKERQSKWMASLYNRSDEELKKMFMERTNHAFGEASGTSMNVFSPLIQWCCKNGISEDEILIGSSTSSEFCLVNPDTKKVFFYDFTIPKLGLIIEYNGETWHPRDENWKPLPCMNTTVEQALTKETAKRELAKINGFDIHYVWDSDEIDSAIESCKSFIASHLQM